MISLRQVVMVTCLGMAGWLYPGSEATAAMLTTTFAGGNGSSGNMFDVAVAGNSLTVTELDVNLATTDAYTIEVWTRSGTWVGSESNSSAWTFLDAVNVSGQGAGNPTTVNIADIVLAANQTTAFYVTTTSNSGTQYMVYSDGAAIGNVAASNADLQILEGTGLSYQFSPSTTPLPRIWNGTITYTVNRTAAVPEPGSFVLLTLGAVGLCGIVRRRTVSRPTAV